VTRDELWTSRALAVDGLRVRLRRFRKSHQFILAGHDPRWAISGLRSAAARRMARANLLRA
jgi:hypothetical protein